MREIGTEILGKGNVEGHQRPTNSFKLAGGQPLLLVLKCGYASRRAANHEGWNDDANSGREVRERSQRDRDDS